MEKQELIARLKEIVDPQFVLTTEMDLKLYSYDASMDRGTPDVVVLPRSTEEVSKIMALCYEEKVPVLGRGSGTNLTGGTIPTKGGVVIHFSRMNKILEVDLPNLTVTVEPGIFTLDLQNQMAALGYMYQPDPASQKVSTIGGNVSENSGGPKCLKYGTTTNHVKALEVVLDDGTVVEMGGKAQDSPGFDLVGLMVGSEGTLGMVTKVTLRLMRKPEAVKTMLAVFNSIQDGANTVSAIIAEGIIPASLEMMDNTMMRAVEATLKVGYPLDAACVLIIELDGMPEGMEDKAEQIVNICKTNNVREVKVARNQEEYDLLWAGRKGAFGSVGQIRPSYMCCDGTVPRTKLPEVLARVMEISEEYNLPIGNVFHAGDGNLHPLILFDDRDQDEVARVHKASSAILKACADVGGTISGEHGVGLEKLKETSFIFCESDLEFERNIKRAMDPTSIINEGKMIPEPECTA